MEGQGWISRYTPRGKALRSDAAPCRASRHMLAERPHLTLCATRLRKLTKADLIPQTSVRGERAADDGKRHKGRKHKHRGANPPSDEAPAAGLSETAEDTAHATPWPDPDDEFERANAAELSALLARAECSQHLQLLRGEKLDMKVLIRVTLPLTTTPHPCPQLRAFRTSPLQICGQQAYRSVTRRRYARPSTRAPGRIQLRRRSRSTKTRLTLCTCGACAGAECGSLPSASHGATSILLTNSNNPDLDASAERTSIPRQS